MRPQLILIGAPGSGKGTQAKKLISEFGYNHVSTGDLLRAEIQKGSDLGERVKSILDAGNLVDDQTVLDLLNANCDIANSTYIFDGYPRNLEQSRALDSEVLKGASSKAIYFDVDLEILVERIVNRRVAMKSGEIYNLITRPPKTPGKCDVSGEDLVHRKDDTEETVRNRMNVFIENVEPVLAYYEQSGRLYRVKASESSTEVFEKIKNLITK
ncbi:adenylate kinase [Bacteriovorax sp. Seq25_V]|uniref:adenylate kinase n=1 Tax=Bacteriovorax sp. Seq25_V TaxID=1201288 RepID=UPI000389F16F|nr:adenylate kinase [Bacteriovorax sp. Seq25_V]EQC46901.1 putative adenylate kinase [Bacteriovorax sp. Seq25_V]